MRDASHSKALRAKSMKCAFYFAKLLECARVLASLFGGGRLIRFQAL